LGIRVMYKLEGKRREEARVGAMVEEVERRSGIRVEHGIGGFGRRWEAEMGYGWSG